MVQSFISKVTFRSFKQTVWQMVSNKIRVPVLGYLKIFTNYSNLPRKFKTMLSDWIFFFQCGIKSVSPTTDKL